MFSFAEIYEEVVGRAGGEQSTAEDVARVERSVRLVLERWQAKRYPTWRVRRISAGVSGATPRIVLPDTVDDVLQVIAMRNGRHVSTLSRVPVSVYAQSAAKMTVGLPGSYWLARDPAPALHIYPIGTPGDPLVLDIWHIARPPENRTGEVPARWTEALIAAAAHDFARKRPLEGGTYDEELIARLKTDRDESEELALNADRDRSRFTYRIG